VTALRARRGLRTSVGMLVLLAIQYGLGLTVALNAHSPPVADTTSWIGLTFDNLRWALGHGSIVLTIHAVVGLALLVCSLAVLALSLSADKKLRVTSVMGTLAVLGAGCSGLGFLDTTQPWVSEMMGACFFVAAVAYIALCGMYGARAPLDATTSEPETSVSPGEHTDG